MKGCIIDANIRGKGQGRLPISLYTLYWDFKIIPFPPHTYVLAKIFQNAMKFIQEANSWFKKSHEDLDNYRQAVESLKIWNLMGYFCPKNTFLQLKHIQRVYLTLLSTCCVKIHQMTYVILETICHFSRHSPSIYQSENFQTCYCLHWNSLNSSCHFWSQEFFFKLCITLQFYEANSSVLFHLNLQLLWTKVSDQSANFQTFDCSHEN